MFYTYQQLITLRKTLPLLTWGDYEDLLPEHPSLWCYRRQWQGQTLVVAANLSRELQAWQPAEAPGEWKMIISNYAETTPRPTGLTLRPFEAIWWLQDNAFPRWRNAHRGYDSSGWKLCAVGISNRSARLGLRRGVLFFAFSRSQARKNG